MANTPELTEDQKKEIAKKTSFGQFILQNIKSWAIRMGSFFAGAGVGVLVFTGLNRNNRTTSGIAQPVNDVLNALVLPVIQFFRPNAGAIDISRQVTTVLASMFALTSGYVTKKIGNFVDSFLTWRKHTRGEVEGEMALELANTTQGQVAAQDTKLREQDGVITQDSTAVKEILAGQQRGRVAASAASPPATHIEKVCQPDKQPAEASL